MEEKYIDDYLDELHGYFPQIRKKDLKRMVSSMTRQLSSYCRHWYRGFSVGSTNALSGETKRNKFIVARIWGKRHLNYMREATKKRNDLKHGKGK